jgi:hypothetical protein
MARHTITVKLEVESDCLDTEALHDAICSCIAGHEFSTSWDGGPFDGQECEFSVVCASTDESSCDTDLARMAMPDEFKRSFLQSRPY